MTTISPSLYSAPKLSMFAYKKVFVSLLSGWQPSYRREKLALLFFILTMCLANPFPAFGRDLFELTVTSETVTSRKGFSDIENFVNQLDNQGLSELIPAYIPNVSEANATLGVRGLPASVIYAQGDTALNFLVPSLGIDLTFNGATRDESQDLFLDFIKGEGQSILSQLLQGLVAETAVDPIAGNPNSLVAMMAASDFTSVTTNIDIEDGEGSAPNLVGIGIMAGTSEATGFRTNMVSLPINYIHTLPDPGYQVILDAPLRYIDLEGAKVYDGSFALGLRVPLLGKMWSVTPMMRAGAVGSTEAGALQAVYSGSATSRLKFSASDLTTLGDLTFTLNNMIGYYQTDGVSEDYGGDYDLENVIFRNGFTLDGSLNFTLFDEPTSWELSFVDTRITGDEWFINGWDEVALTFGTRRREGRMLWQALRFGVSYTFSNDYDGFQVVLGYRF